MNYDDSITIYALIFVDYDLWIKAPLKSVFIFQLNNILVPKIDKKRKIKLYHKDQ